MVLEVIQREVSTRGIGYLVLRDCPEDRLGEALGKGMERLKKAGARQVWAASLPEGAPLQPGPIGVWRLNHVHDMIEMSVTLGADRPHPEDRLLLKPVKRAADERVWLELANRAFETVTGTRTYTSADFRTQNHRFGLAWQGEKAVGVYDLDMTDKVPCLTALAIAKDLQHQRLGRLLLLTLLEAIPKAPSCTLRVSTANEPAINLFESAGFAQIGITSSWFEVV